MIHSTKKDQYWSFWYHWWSNHQDQDVLWGNRAVEAVEASEVAEAAEVHETEEVSKAQKITTEDFIGSCIHQFGDKNNLILMCCKKNFFWQNHENPIWILAFFLSEAVEASLCYFFENSLKNLKCQKLLKSLGTVPQSHLVSTISKWDTLHPCET